jgi:hypothetical protein
MGQNLRKGHIRDALINFATGAELAMAVLSMILPATPDGILISSDICF